MMNDPYREKRERQMHMYSAIHTQETRKRDCNNKKLLPIYT